MTRTTKYNFPNKGLQFTDEVAAVREEARILKRNGIDIIISAGHSGYDVDQAFRGDITELNMWDKILDETDIDRMAQCRYFPKGNVVSWEKSKL